MGKVNSSMMEEPVNTDAQTLLLDASRSAPRSTVEAAARVLRASAEPTQGAFFARALNALVRLAPALGGRALGEATGAPSDVEVLRRALSRPEALMPPDDPAPRTDGSTAGLGVKERLLRAEGGVLPVTEVARVLGISRQAVDKRRRAGRLIGLSLGRRGYAYPAWQLHGGSTLLGLEQVLAALGEDDPWVPVIFLLNPHERLSDKTPLDALRDGRVEEVARVARWFGEQVAD